jgi:hypothetical protein
MLSEAYAGIDNMTEAVAHLHSALCRGYAHLEVQEDEDDWET